MTHAEKIAALKCMLTIGMFHHATHRNSGPSLWNGLWIYERTLQEGGRFFQAYQPAFCFFDSEGHAEQAEAYALVRGTGVSLGSYGNG